MPKSKKHQEETKSKQKSPVEEVKAEVEPQGEQVSEIESLKAALAESQDKLLRAHAEMENLRKRTSREIEDARKFGIEKFAASLLDVVDNLERALATEAGNEEALRDGVQLTLDNWHSLMTRFHMERIDAVGEQFDPHLHEALSQLPNEAPEGTVIAQHVAGYSLHGRLIRPAKVLVSSGPQN